MDGEGKGAGCCGEGEPSCILDSGTLKFMDDLSQRLPSGASIEEITTLSFEGGAGGSVIWTESERFSFFFYFNDLFLLLLLAFFFEVSLFQSKVLGIKWSPGSGLTLANKKKLN